MALLRMSSILVQSPQRQLSMVPILARSFTSKEPVATTSSTTSKSADKKSPPVGDSASSTGETYQVQEYFNHGELTYYDIESDMVKHRLPQPVAK